MQDLIIQPQTGKKGRSFRSTCVTAVTCDGLFPEGGSGNTIRPAWAMFAGSDAELRPFTANLRLGRKAEPDTSGHYNRRGGDSVRYEFLKSVGYHAAWQKEAEGSLVTLFHPDLFRLDPGMVDPRGIQFAMLVPEEWSRAQTVEMAGPIKHAKRVRKVWKCNDLSDAVLETLVPAAYLFAAYVDRRTRCPLLADGSFYIQALIAALDQGIASLPGDSLNSPYYRSEWGHNKDHGFNAIGLETVGITHAFSVKASHADFEKFLAEQVSQYFDLCGDFVSLGQRVDLSSFEELV